MSLEHAFELYVLEYLFAFWQLGIVGFEEIPNETTLAKEIEPHILKVTGVDFFE